MKTAKGRNPTEKGTVNIYKVDTQFRRTGLVFPPCHCSLRGFAIPRGLAEDPLTHARMLILKPLPSQ